MVEARSEDFKAALMVAEFNKLKQSGSLNDYIAKFQDLRSRILLINSETRLTEAYFIGSFISGLSDEMQSFLALFEPPTLQQAIHLATKREQIIDALTNNKPSSTKLLTPTEMKTRIEKGLCYNCDEKFTITHSCKNKQVLFAMMKGEDKDKDKEEPSSHNKAPKKAAKAKTKSSVVGGNGVMIYGGRYGEHELRIKLVSGSTHSVLDEETAMKLGCFTEPAPLMEFKSVLPGGTKMLSSKIATDFTWTMEDRDREVVFSHSMRVMKVWGCHMILGVDWFMKNSPIGLADRMVTLQRHGQEIQLRPIAESGEGKKNYFEIGAMTGVLVQPATKSTY